MNKLEQTILFTLSTTMGLNSTIPYIMLNFNNICELCHINSNSLMYIGDKGTEKYRRLNLFIYIIIKI